MSPVREDVTLPEPLLTAAMIVRDEAEHLPACLESIRNVVDEIVIVDTGSTDDTVSIARSYGARVEIHPWREDFATPRNLGLDLARGRWILYIDADERLRPVSVASVRARLERAEEVALRVRLKLFSGATPAWEYRLWRSDPRIRFAGVMHEKVTSAIARVAKADQLAIGESDLFLDHIGYDGDQAHKHRRNLSLLRAELAADPVNAYNWRHLAIVLEALGEPDEAGTALERALEVGRDRQTGADAITYLEMLRRRLEQGDGVAELLDEALSRYPDNFGLAWHKVITEIQAGRPEAALGRLERFDVDPEMPVEDGLSYRSELFEARAAEARGLCLFRLGQYREAALAYGRAERLEPDAAAHRLKRVLAEHRAGAAGDGSEPARPAEPYRWRARELLSGWTVDIGGVPVGLRTTDAARAEAMRSLLGRLPPSDREPTKWLTFNRHGPPAPASEPDEWQGGLRLWHGDDALTVAAGPSISGRVEGDRATIGGFTADLGHQFRLVAPFMLARLLAVDGAFLLHAAAVQRDGTAVLVPGGSGGGKSTLVLGVLQAGWRVLSDDLVILRASPSGAEVRGLPKPLHVPRESLGPLGPPESLAVDARGRVELPFEDWDSEWREIGAVVVPGHGTQSTAEAEPIGAPELLGILIRSMLSRHPGDVSRYFGLAARMSQLPSFRLRHSSDHALRPRQAAELVAARLAPLRRGGVDRVHRGRVRDR
jgi:tetratricopeptide (TPR) repeat protein